VLNATNNQITDLHIKTKQVTTLTVVDMGMGI